MSSAWVGAALTLVLAGCSLTTDSGGGSSGIDQEIAAEPAADSTPTETATTATTAQLSSTTTSSTTPPEPRPVSVVVHPAEAVVELSTADGFNHRAEAQPVTVDVPAAVVTVRASAPGYETYEGEIALDADGGPNETTIWLDKEGQLVHKLFEVEVSGAPKGVAFTPDGSEIWTTILNEGGVDVIDVATGQVIDVIDLDQGAVEVIFNRSGTTAYVSQMQTNSVFEIDVASRSVKRQLDTKGAWTKVMALSSDEQTLYASNWIDNNVSEIDLADGEVNRLLSTVRTPRGLYPTADGKRLYVAGFESGDLEVIDLTTGDSETLHHTGGSMRHLVGSPDGSIVYASDMTRDTIFAVDTATDDVTVLATSDRKPNTIDISPDGRVLFVSNRGRNNPKSYYLPGPEWGTVLLIDTETGAMLDGIVGGNQTTGLAVSDDGSKLVFSDLLDNRVVVYSVPPTEQLLAGGGGRYEAHLSDLVK